MLDYHANCVALNELASALSARSFAEPALTSAKTHALSAIKDEPGSALLGALAHHLISHAASDGAELDLLQRAADLWSTGAGLFGQLGTIRNDIEQAMQNPAAPGAADTFNNAAVDAQNLANAANQLRVLVNTLRLDALKFPHLPPHPRQRDLKIQQWDWGNLVAARRTDAFVRTVFRGASDPSSLAFAVGTASAYGVHAAGSSYLAQAAGGPRRTQRHRDRIGRNAIGGWLAAHHPAAMSPSRMADRIAFGPAAAPAMPAALDSLMQAALAKTYGSDRASHLPDLQLGYTRLLRHLRLLQSFVAPAIPVMPPLALVASVLSDPQNPPPSLRAQAVDVSAQDGGGESVTIPLSPSPGSTTPSSADDHVKTGCAIGAIIIILADLLQAFIHCIVQWGEKKRCTFWDNMLLRETWKQDPPDPRAPNGPQSTQVTAQQLTAVSTSPQAAQMIWMLYDTHNQVWEAMSKAYEFLAVTGLIYPDNFLQASPYAQFISLPATLPWPHRATPREGSFYNFYPASPIENPATQASVYTTASDPSVIFQPDQFPAAGISLQLWRQIAAGDADSRNLDLDADRGIDHACWTSNNSVLQDPVDVVILDYDKQ